MITKKFVTMDMTQSNKGAKKFTEQEKLSILKEAENEGVKKTLGIPSKSLGIRKEKLYPQSKKESNRTNNFFDDVKLL